MKRLTLKQRRLARHLPTSNTIKEAGKKAGYSETTKSIYNDTTKDYLKDIYSKDWILSEIKRCGKLAEIDKDYNVMMTGLMNLAKLLGYTIDLTPQIPLHITFSTEKDKEIRRKYLSEKEL